MIDYKSPIEIAVDEMHSQMMCDYENGIMKAIQRYNINVDKEELLKALQYDRGQYNKGYQDGLNADKWIPCEERLPSEENKLYLTYKGSDNIQVLNWTKKGFNTYKHEDGSYYSTFEIKNIIAWQPLPQPYKKEGAEND